LDQKGYREKAEEDKLQDIKEQPTEEKLIFPYLTHLVKNLIDKDPNLDFMDPNKREKLSEIY
jgi:hypothetical protein